MSENSNVDVMFFEKNFSCYLPISLKDYIKENYEKIFGTNQNLKPSDAFQILIDKAMKFEAVKNQTLTDYSQEVKELQSSLDNAQSENQLLKEALQTAENNLLASNAANSQINFGNVVSEIQFKTALEFLKKPDVINLINESNQNGKFNGIINKINQADVKENVLNLFVDVFMLQAIGNFNITPSKQTVNKVINETK